MTELSLRGVGKRYGRVAAVTGIDLTAPAGARTAIVGPSGSGKTTLLRLIAGLEIPDEGRILLDGQLIADPGASVPAHRRNIGLVMQDGALFPHLSVIDNIRFGMRRRQVDSTTRAMELLDMVELDRSMAARQPHELSGGQQQRVALARALARRPGVMLLDEPFSALDAGLREQMRQAAAGILGRAGITTILVTHDQEEAMSFADHLVVLRGGRLVQAGPPRALYRAPADPVTAAFLGDAIILDAVVANGSAECSLGRVGVNGGREGPATIMLRPEQVVLRPAGSGQADGDRVRARLLDAHFAGPNARVTLAVLPRDGTPTGEATVAFKAPAAALPDIGSLVELDIAGQAHAFDA